MIRAYVLHKRGGGNGAGGARATKKYNCKYSRYGSRRNAGLLCRRGNILDAESEICMLSLCVEWIRTKKEFITDLNTE